MDHASAPPIAGDDADDAAATGANRSTEAGAAPIRRAVKGDVSAAELIGLGAHEPALVGTDAEQWLAAGRFEPEHHSHAEGHGHDHACSPGCDHDHTHHHHHAHGHDHDCAGEDCA
ncbi:MAG: hypothetical protein J0H99_19630, partial [Rhodospirillales bacterium]|nr:hypothetical protein [Rhodospirillales bacterium]